MCDVALCFFIASLGVLALAGAWALVYDNYKSWEREDVG